jgi:hypothetical protein
MAARPAAWLKEEVTAVTAGQQLREQVSAMIGTECYGWLRMAAECNRCAAPGGNDD